MNLILLLAAAATIAPDTAEGEPILVTGSREPVEAAGAPVSATIFEREWLESLSLPLAQDVLRLAPGVTIAQTGPHGTQAQLRIRGAEANHSLLFVDGIRFNDPAAGNEARFEMLASDALSRIEIVRGPQSALWGSEALGGVVAAETGGGGRGIEALAEYGSLASARASTRFAFAAGPLALSGAAGWLSSDGIDSFAHGGERDGFGNGSASLKAVLRPLPALELGLVGHWIASRSQYDDVDPVTFRRADTLHETRNRIGAVRAWAELETNGWTLRADSSWLGSANRNLLAEAPLNRTAGERLTASAQVSKRAGGHRVTLALDHEAEDFRARDILYGGATDQKRSRRLTAIVGEWRAEWNQNFSTDLAVRRDSFSAFADATTLRASAILRPAEGWQLHAAYGEGIAQPTFYDLHGFFPGSFRGNPDLRPERSKGMEAGLRWRGDKAELGITGFSNRLRDEIVATFDPATFLSGTANAVGRSRRRGIEVEGSYRPSDGIELRANYTWLDAEEPQAGAALVKEVRRPRHSANLAASGTSGPISWGAGLSYVGARTDEDFDLFPARVVRLDDYLLGSVRVGWKLTPRLEAYARAENLFDERYQDVVGYRTAGRTVHAGLRLRLGN